MTGAGSDRRSQQPGSRRSGRHAGATATVVRLTDAAFEDLVALNRSNTPALRWALKKLLLLERDPEAGEELHGSLIGYRKLTISNRTWRVVWRVTNDESGSVIVDVAEVWAVGARSDAEVYAEMNDRIRSLPRTPTTLALAEVIARLGKAASGITAAAEPEVDVLPTWLVDNLVHQAGMTRRSAAELTLKEAVDLWTEWISRPKS